MKHDITYYKNRKACELNFQYFMDHAEEIINDTEHVLTPYRFNMCILRGVQKEFPGIAWYGRRLKETHENMWMLFARGDRFLKRGEDRNEGLDRVDWEYCEATGHWDLFVWRTEEELDKRQKEKRKKFKEWKKKHPEYFEI